MWFIFTLFVPPTFLLTSPLMFVSTNLFLMPFLPSWHPGVSTLHSGLAGLGGYILSLGGGWAKWLSYLYTLPFWLKLWLENSSPPPYSLVRSSGTIGFRRVF